MAKRPKVRMPHPSKRPMQKVPDAVKSELTAKAQQLLDEHLKPQHVKPPLKNTELNYITDLSTLWHQSYFYFCATYASPHPEAPSPTFEVRFARMGYEGDGKFSLS